MKKATISNEHSVVEAAAVTVIPEGVTAASIELVTKCKDEGLHQLSPINVQLLDKVFDFLGKDNPVIAEIATKGVENLATCLVELGKHDALTAIQAIKAIMRQLTKDAHYRFVAVQKEQMLASRAHGGGVQGYELSVNECIERYGNYDGTSSYICTPAEQVEAVKDMHVMLNGLYVALEHLRLHWLSKSDFIALQLQLPFCWYVDDNGKYQELDNFESSIQYLDDKYVEKAEKRLVKRKNALTALKDLKIA